MYAHTRTHTYPLICDGIYRSQLYQSTHMTSLLLHLTSGCKVNPEVAYYAQNYSQDL